MADVDVLLGSLSARQFAEWIAFWREEPWGSEREDLRAGLVASMIGNAYRKKGARPFKPDEFFGRMKVNRKQSVAEMVVIGMQWVAASGGKIITPGRQTPNSQNPPAPRARRPAP